MASSRSYLGTTRILCGTVLAVVGLSGCGDANTQDTSLGTPDAAEASLDALIEIPIDAKPESEASVADSAPDRDAAVADVAVEDAMEADAVQDAPGDSTTDGNDAQEGGSSPNCTMCHGDPAKGEAAPPKDTKGNVDTTARGVGAHQAHRKSAKADQGVPHAPIPCKTCHLVPGDVAESGHLDSTPGAEVVWSGLAMVAGATPQPWQSNVDTQCSGTYCHGATLADGANTKPTWTMVGSYQAGCGACHGLPPSGKHPNNNQCQTCHGDVIADCPVGNPSGCTFQEDVSPTQSYKLHIDGKLQVIVNGCTGCHGAPPNNAAHAIHASGADAPTSYGSLEPRANATSYGFNCGFCHPLDVGKHMNGTLEVELYNAQAPAAPTDPASAADRRSIKRENSLAAYVPGTTTLQGEAMPYTNGSCARVYCHSEQVETALTVPLGLNPSQLAPLKFSWVTVDSFMNAGANVCCQNGPTNDYPDFTITVSRAYANPQWVGQTHTGADKCSHCHGYPPRSTPPTNQGAGEGHSWIVPATYGGYEQGHFFNMGAGFPVQCKRCHRSTVATDVAATGWHYVPGDGTFVYDSPTPISGFDAHVNGKKDVVFDLSPAGCGVGQPDLQYKNTHCLTTATWEPSSRSCNNVECHQKQTKVVWGAPYRDGVGQECNACHQF